MLTTRDVARPGDTTFKDPTGGGVPSPGLCLSPSCSGPAGTPLPQLNSLQWLLGGLPIHQSDSSSRVCMCCVQNSPSSLPSQDLYMCYDQLTKLISASGALHMLVQLTKFIPASGPLHMLFSQATPVYLCLIIHILVHCYLLGEFFSDHYQRSHHILLSPYPILLLQSCHPT